MHTLSCSEWEHIAKLLEKKGLGSGGSVQRLALLMGIITVDRQIKANIPSKDISQFAQVRYKFLLEAPFNVSNRCCSIFKKNLSHKYNHDNNMHPIIASMASESRLRTQKWLENGCNGFNLKEPVSNPMSFWDDSDVLLYIKKYGLKIAEPYGEIVTDYKAEGQCEGQISFADLGLFDKRPNRLEMIDKVSNPAIRDWILRGGSFDKNGIWKPDNNGLGFWFVYQWINIHGGFDIYIPEYERYHKEYGTELTEEYLKV